LEPVLQGIFKFGGGAESAKVVSDADFEVVGDAGTAEHILKHGGNAGVGRCEFVASEAFGFMERTIGVEGCEWCACACAEGNEAELAEL
jgi:hypothetical protein